MNTYFTEYFLDLVSSEWAWDLVALNLVLITGLLYVLKFNISYVAGVSMQEELAEKDNHAFGAIIAFTFLSFFLVMSAASTGDDRVSILKETTLMLSYGVGGMVMIFLSRLILDKVAMKKFCLQEQIRKGNMAAAIVDGGNMLATAMIVFAYMGWVKGTSVNTILLVVFGWLMSQILLSGLSMLRAKLYKSEDGTTLESAIENGNIAVALRYSAYKLSFAFTPIIAAMHYPYQDEDCFWYACAILMSSVLLFAVIKVATSISKRIVLPKLNYAEEINRDANIGVAMIEVCILFGITIAFFGLLQ